MHFVRRAFLFCALAGTATAQSDGLSIPSAHPRLFWTPAKLSQAQAWVAKTGYKGRTDYGRTLDGYDILFTCYVMGNGTACANALSYSQSFVPSGVGSLGSDDVRVYAEVVALGYDWLYPQWTDAQRTAFYTNWSNWMGAENAQAWGGVTMQSSNYFFGRIRADFVLGVGTYLDNSNAPVLLDRALGPSFATSYWPAFVNFTTPSPNPGPNAGGGYGFFSQEGSQYGRYALSYLAYLVPSASLLGRNLWSETKALQSAVFQTIYATVPQPTVRRSNTRDIFSWSDDQVWQYNSCSGVSHNGPNADGGCGAAQQYFGDYMQMAANEQPGTAVGRLARQWIADVHPATAPAFLATDPGDTTQPYTTLPLDYFASGPQYAWWRSDWTPNASALMIQAGQESPAAGHYHVDWGNFQWFRKGAWLVRETPSYTDQVAGLGRVGIGTSDGFLGHNVPVVGGLGPVNAGCTDGPAVVNRLETQPEYAYLDVDLSKVYSNAVCGYDHPERGNPYARHVEREFLFLRDIETLLILDRVQADNATRSRTFLSRCETAPTATDSSHYACVNGTQKAAYTMLLPANPSLLVVPENANGGNNLNWTYRMEVSDIAPAGAQSYFLTAIQGLDATATPLAPVLVDNGNSWTITLDPNHTVTLSKGTNSAGGSVTANGMTWVLRGNVQSMAVTDDGPRWDIRDGIKIGGRGGLKGSVMIR
jgi:hypothetical protein